MGPAALGEHGSGVGVMLGGGALDFAGEGGMGGEGGGGNRRRVGAVGCGLSGT